MNKKAIDYSLIMLFIVLVAIPVLYWRMTTKVELMKKTFGDDQLIILNGPYDKEDIINFVKKSADLAAPVVLKKTAESNGYVNSPCGGTHNYKGKTCAIINQNTQICPPNTLEVFTHYFNQELDKYIQAHNELSITKIPLNSYPFITLSL